MKQGIPIEGTIVEQLANGRYLVQLDSGHLLNLYTSGRVAKARLTIVPGDRVAAELSIYDPRNGRILRRL